MGGVSPSAHGDDDSADERTRGCPACADFGTFAERRTSGRALRTALLGVLPLRTDLDDQPGDAGGECDYGDDEGYEANQSEGSRHDRPRIAVCRAPA